MPYEADCAAGNDFSVRSEDREEAVQMLKRHAREKHDRDLSDGEAREMVTEG